MGQSGGQGEGEDFPVGGGKCGECGGDGGGVGAGECHDFGVGFGGWEVGGFVEGAGAGRPPFMRLSAWRRQMPYSQVRTVERPS
ncbi:hypothetical protein GCM10027612_49740 [Microbispora bryophytorum subsp. camponoti]